MSTERVVVRGFCNRKEEKIPIYEEEHFTPVEENGEEQNSINLNWIIWAFAIAIALTLGISITSLI